MKNKIKYFGIFPNLVISDTSKPWTTFFVEWTKNIKLVQNKKISSSWKMFLLNKRIEDLVCNLGYNDMSMRLSTWSLQVMVDLGTITKDCCLWLKRLHLRNLRNFFKKVEEIQSKSKEKKGKSLSRSKLDTRESFTPQMKCLMETNRGESYNSDDFLFYYLFNNYDVTDLTLEMRNKRPLYNIT